MHYKYGSICYAHRLLASQGQGLSALYLQNLTKYLAYHSAQYVFSKWRLNSLLQFTKHFHMLSSLVFPEILWGSLGASVDEEIRAEKAGHTHC